MPSYELNRRVIEAFLDLSFYPKKEPAITLQVKSTVFEAIPAILIEHGPGAAFQPLSTV